jgi:FkbM family methyltransferase
MKSRLLRLLGHQSWLRFGVRDRVIRFFCDPDDQPPRPFDVRFFGGVYSGDLSSFIDWSVYHYGAYEREELRFIEDVCARLGDPLVIDVGANVGQHALFAALRGARVIAFEPYPKVADVLESRMQQNGCADRVRLVRIALGAENGQARFIVPRGHNEGTGTLSGADDPTTFAAITVPVRIGDEILREIAPGAVHLLKIDTEGFEVQVLEGLRATLETWRPIVFFEWTPAKQSRRRSPDASDLFPAGYRFCRFIGDDNVLGLFRRPTYRLGPLPDDWPACNVVALPVESRLGLGR